MIRTQDLGKMRKLREEWKLRFKEFSGKGYGMAVCSMLNDIGPIWIDIVMMARFSVQVTRQLWIVVFRLTDNMG